MEYFIYSIIFVIIYSVSERDSLCNLYQCRKHNRDTARVITSSVEFLAFHSNIYIVTWLYLIKIRAHERRCIPNFKVPMIKIFINLVIHRHDTYRASRALV